MFPVDKHTNSIVPKNNKIVSNDQPYKKKGEPIILICLAAYK